MDKIKERANLTPFVEAPIPDGLLVLTQGEYLKAKRRGDSVLRNRELWRKNDLQAQSKIQKEV
jgi:hypothetical protein